MNTSAAPAASAAPVSLFYSLANEDASLCDELQGRLKILARRGLRAPWHDRRIEPGQDWAGEIDTHLREAELVLLLISKDFIESDSIMGTELCAPMQRHAEARSVVVPIVVRAVDLDPADADALPFLKLQGLPTGLKLTTAWANRDEAWTDVAKGLRVTILAKLQIEGVAARSTTEALTRIDTDTDTEGFDFVISDWTRDGEPPKAGLALLGALHSRARTMPVVRYHGARSEQRAERSAQARRAGAFGGVRVPAELMAYVQKALGG